MKKLRSLVKNNSMKKLIFISTLTFALVGGMASTALAQPNTEVAPTSKAVIVVDKEVFYTVVNRGKLQQLINLITNFNKFSIMFFFEVFFP